MIETKEKRNITTRQESRRRASLGRNNNKIKYFKYKKEKKRDMKIYLFLWRRTVAVLC